MILTDTKNSVEGEEIEDCDNDDDFSFIYLKSLNVSVCSALSLSPFLSLFFSLFSLSLTPSIKHSLTISYSLSSFLSISLSSSPTPSLSLPLCLSLFLSFSLYLSINLSHLVPIGIFPVMIIDIEGTRSHLDRGHTG